MHKTDTPSTVWVEPKDPELSVLYLNLDEIRRDGGTQPRAAIDLKHVKLLSEQIEDGQELEPVIVFYDGESYWLADGFHRFSAHRNQEKQEIACVIHQGARRDAVLYSVGANADHKPALPRSREDKRRAVLTLLEDSQWGQWSNYKIAAACRVNEKTVRNVRTSLTTDFRSEKSTRTYKTKHGTIAAMDTANIGKTSHSTKKDALNNSLIDLKVSDGITVTADHSLFPNSSGAIIGLLYPDAAYVELDTGEREIIQRKHLLPSLADQLKLVEGGLVEVYAPDHKKINGRWGRVASVGQHNANVWLRDIDEWH